MLRYNGKKAGVVLWYLIATILLFSAVFYGLAGRSIVQDIDANCTAAYGVMCFSWEMNDSVDSIMGERDDGVFHIEGSE